MPCYCAHDHAAARLFSRFARCYRRRFARGHFEPVQRRLLDALSELGLEGAELLEIGSGVGALHLHLLEQGVARAVGVDLSPKMIEEARSWAEERGLGERVDYRVGDYLVLADEIAPVDITVMDKVICCHPLGPELVATALPHTRRALALSYPRISAITRMGARLVNGVMALLRSEFRVYLHDPETIEAVAKHHGFLKRREGTAGFWQFQLFVRGQ